MTRFGASRAVLVAAAVTLSQAPARAQSSVSVRTEVSARQVEAGDDFVVQVTALGAAGESPSQPRLAVPRGVAAHGPSVSTQQQISIVNGRMEQRTGITATWTVTAAGPGKYRIGPGSVVAGGKRITGQVVEVEVVPRGSGGSPGPRRRGRGSWPFDPFGFPTLPNFPGFPFGNDDDDPSLDQLPPVPEELQIDRALDATAFLNATVDKQRLVVGEQLTLRIVAYGSRGPFRETNTTEPSRGDFLGFVIVENMQTERHHLVPIDNAVWHAVKVREMALFPIRAGTLTIGPMKMGFDGRGYPSSGRHQGLTRQSSPITLSVTEPPLQGRPAGYRVGDVGSFRLSASVEPRQVRAGEAVSVVVTLEGTGNLPYKLRTPQQHGVEWLEPTLTSAVEPENGVVGGNRKFTYVVRLNSGGSVDLGEITLPYWDPALGKYEIASAVLGAVQVTGTRDQPSKPEPARNDALDGLLAPRTALGEPAATRTYLPDRRWYWGMLLLGPAAVMLTTGGLRIGKKLRSRWAARRHGHASRIAQALAEARRATEPAAEASHVERAIFSAIEASLELKARGLLRGELVPALTKLGVDAELARDTADILEACDAVRFTGAISAAPGELVTRATDVVKRIERVRVVKPSAEQASG